MSKTYIQCIFFYHEIDFWENTISIYFFPTTGPCRVERTGRVALIGVGCRVRLPRGWYICGAQLDPTQTLPPRPCNPDLGLDERGRSWRGGKLPWRRSPRWWRWGSWASTWGWRWLVFSCVKFECMHIRNPLNNQLIYFVSYSKSRLTNTPSLSKEKN